jgi:dolichol-phosphate mannosyltransferase
MYLPEQFVSIVVPTYNERANLRPLAARIFATLSPAHCELLLVDDNSPDGTAAESAAVAAALYCPS